MREALKDLQESPIDRARLHTSSCLESLQSDVKRLSRDPWTDHVNSADYSGGWDVLPLRCLRRHRDAHPILQAFAHESEDEWVDLPSMACTPAISAVVESLQCPVQSVRLMRLKPGAIIKPHRDHQLSLEYGLARLHMPIVMEDDVQFVCNHNPVPMKPGELWYINVDKTHSVRNTGTTDRINLVIDCIANDWLKNKVLKG
ncbi:aspartyl/asparaginyl beta-hydroxylase [Marinimicrobium koreense]|uniref:Aspartyl/asparaginyl beta-hydroxylase n=2 Tax=Marinimicrobium koreense TaxID=306545 RepID=A0A3N1NZA1_9GAMM|nr:aspartyl/asparaginyl beta-hydroxylase [Marinimicrobium koreense]